MRTALLRLSRPTRAGLLSPLDLSSLLGERLKELRRLALHYLPNFYLTCPFLHNLLVRAVSSESVEHLGSPRLSFVLFAKSSASEAGLAFVDLLEWAAVSPMCAKSVTGSISG